MRAMGAWMREKKKRETVAVTCKKWGQTGEEGIESWEVGLGVCVCVLLCVAMSQARAVEARPSGPWTCLRSRGISRGRPGRRPGGELSS